MALSTFPPVTTTIISFSLSLFLEKMAAAAATAPPGSETILKCWYKNFMAFKTSVSLATRPSPSFLFNIGKVNSPGVGVKIASHIDGLLFSLISLFPDFNDRAVSS